MSFCVSNCTHYCRDSVWMLMQYIIIASKISNQIPDCCNTCFVHFSKIVLHIFWCCKLFVFSESTFIVYLRNRQNNKLWWVLATTMDSQAPFPVRSWSCRPTVLLRNVTFVVSEGILYSSIYNLHSCLQQQRTKNILVKRFWM